MAFVPLIYLALAMAWIVLPFLAMKQTRFATPLLVGHVAVGAVACLYAAVFTQLGALLLFCAGPGTFMSLFFVVLRMAFPDKKNESR
ncbi:hypothetical protein [Streptomyces sp. NBC_01508]|uniref:hypothetical protein n=1 Tax=Streptomyces sp. NBC_01508 TaxID=2903888 RepID=UPI00386A64A4